MPRRNERGPAMPALSLAIGLPGERRANAGANPAGGDDTAAAQHEVHACVDAETRAGPRPLPDHGPTPCARRPPRDLAQATAVAPQGRPCLCQRTPLEVRDDAAHSASRTGTLGLRLWLWLRLRLGVRRRPGAAPGPGAQAHLELRRP